MEVDSKLAGIRRFGHDGGDLFLPELSASESATSSSRQPETRTCHDRPMSHLGTQAQASTGTRRPRSLAQGTNFDSEALQHTALPLAVARAVCHCSHGATAVAALAASG